MNLGRWISVLWAILVLGGALDAQAQEMAWDKERRWKETPTVPSVAPDRIFLGELGEAYQNYAFTGYRNYDTLTGRPPWVNIYDPLGHFLISGQEVYAWYREQSVEGGMRGGGSSQSGGLGAFSGILSIGGQNRRGWASRLTLSGGLDFWTEGIITRFTPLTLNRVSLHGARGDVLTPFGDALSLIAARAYMGYSQLNDSGILLGGHYEHEIGPLRVGATFVNQHLFDVRDPINDLRGDVHASQTIPALFAVRISDDSPEDGQGGPVVYGVDVVVNGQIRPDLAPDVIRRDLTHRFTVVGQTSRTTGEFMPSVYFDAGVGRSTGPYYGMEIPLFADYLYRRDYELDPSDSEVAKNTDLDRLVQFVGWEDPSRILRADGTECLVYYFDLEGEPYVRSVEVVATLGNDYRIEVSALSVSDPKAKTYDRRYDAPFYRTVRHAPGYVQDLSNVRRVRIPIGIETGQSVWGWNMALDLPGLRVRGEYAESLIYSRYPDGRPGEQVALAGGLPALREWHGARHRSWDRAWYVQVQRETARYALGGELFSIGPMFNQRLTLRPGNTTISSNAQYSYQRVFNQTTFLSLLEDNDDQDAIPETILMGTAGTPDYAVFPRQDADNDGIPDANRNLNNLPDYLEPFLLYDVDPDEYVYGLDFNNNDVVDEREDDREVDLPYDQDLRGGHGYVCWQAWKGLSATVGWLDSRQIAGGGRNDQWYARVRYRWEHPRVGEWIVEDELKRVWDEVPNDVFSWTPSTVDVGTYSKRQIKQSGRFAYWPEFVTDPLNYRNSLVNRVYMSGTLTWLPGWKIASRVKVEHNRQYGGRLEDGTEQPRDRIYALAWVQQADYTWNWRRLTVRPALKGLWLKRTRERAGRALVHTRTVVPMVTARYRLSAVTELKIGIQGLPGWWFRRTDLVEPRNSFEQQTIMVVLSNMTDYSGYRISTNLGVTHDRLEFKDPFRSLENYTTTSIFLRVFLGYETSVLY